MAVGCSGSGRTELPQGRELRLLPLAVDVGLSQALGLGDRSKLRVPPGARAPHVLKREDLRKHGERVLDHEKVPETLLDTTNCI